MKIVGIGTSLLDMLVRVNRGNADKLVKAVLQIAYEEELDPITVVQRLGEMDYPDSQAVVGGGGTIHNVLAAASRRGQATAVVGAVGDDPAGKRVRNGLIDAGVDVSLLETKKGKRTQICALALTGRIENPRQKTTKFKPSFRMANYRVPDAPFVLVTSKTGKAVFEVAQRANRFVLAINKFSQENGTQEQVVRRLAHAHVVAFSEGVLREMAFHYAFEKADAKETAGGVVAALLADFARLETVIVTLGKQGVVYAVRGDTPTWQPAFAVEQVDPTGAGDTFLGTLLAELIQAGWPGVTLTASVVQPCVEAATKCAAEAVTWLGARPPDDAVRNQELLCGSTPACLKLPRATRFWPGHPMRLDQDGQAMPFGGIEGLPIPVILDTDLGTDVDDAVALAAVLALPELFRLSAIVCTYNPAESTSEPPNGNGARHRLTRATMARKLLMLRGGDAVHVPVGVTNDAPLSSTVNPIYWEGWEGRGLLDGTERYVDLASPPDGVTLLLKTLRTTQRPVVILAIGPMTTLAIALQREPQLFAEKVRGIAAMSGYFGGGEHNVRCDHGAATVIYESDIPLAITPADVTRDFRLFEAERRGLSPSTPFGHAILQQVEEYCFARKRNWTLLNDPLAVLTPFVEEARFWDATLTPVSSGKLRKFASSSRRPIKVCLDVDLRIVKRRLYDALKTVL